MVSCTWRSIDNELCSLRSVTMFCVDENICVRLRGDLESNGFCVIRGAFGNVALNSLRNEATTLRRESIRTDVTDGTEYRASRSILGPYSRAVMSSSSLLTLMESLFEKRFTLSVLNSCLTYYEAGDKLGLHLDKPKDRCEITAIACLQATINRDIREEGSALRIFGKLKPTRQIAADRTIPSQAGDLVLGKGSEYWHDRPTLLNGESVWVLACCYAAEMSCG